SLLLLRYVARHPAAGKLLLLGTYREHGLSPAAGESLDALRRDGLAEALPLSGLSEGEVEALLAAWGGEESLAPALWRETKGNPFFVGEMLQHLREAGAAPASSPPGLDLARVGVPRNVSELIARRLQRLGEPLDRALPIAAVLGRSFSFDLLQPLVGIPPDELSERLEAAIAAGLVVESQEAPGLYAFSHGLVRQTLYDGLSAERRRQLHRKAGEALERQGAAEASLAQLAHHFLASGNPEVAERAADYARRAGERALAGLAYEEAVEWFRRGAEALAQVPGEERRRCELLLAMGRARSRAGDPSGARSTFGRAAELAHRIGAAQQLASAALEFGVRYPEAGLLDEELVALLEGALAALPDRDSALRAMVLARLGQSLYYSPDRERWRELAERGVAMGRRVGDEPSLARVLAATTFWDPDDHGRRSDVADELVALAERIDDKELILLARHWRSWNALELGDRRAAEREREAVDGVAAALRQPFLQRFSARWRVVGALLDGRLGEVEGLIAEAVETGQRAQSDDTGQIAALQLLLLRREEGRVAELLPAVREFGARYPRVPAWRCGTALAHAEAGDLATASSSYETFAAERFANVPRDVFWLVGISFLAEACAWLGDRERAPALREALAPYADRVVIVGDAACLGPAARPLALMETLTERWSQAQRAFERALTVARNLASPTLEGHIQVDYAAMLRRRGGDGDQQRAGQLLAAAGATAGRLDVARLAQRVMTEGETPAPIRREN
ncbi:MAG TPA: hypothetical protein VEB65_13150, partial [Solirubrobacterales bacterium]|nr:hypothetical protein [Solirubrobacterales bacterium]